MHTQCARWGRDEEDDVTIEGSRLKSKGAYSVPSRLKDLWISLLLELRNICRGLLKQSKLPWILSTRRKVREDVVRYIEKWFYEASCL